MASRKRRVHATTPRRVFEKRWERLIRTWRSLRRDYSNDNVHDVRVAIRRLLTLMDVYLWLKPKAHPKQCRKRLKDILELSSPLRDAQVQREWVVRSRKAHPELAEFGADAANRELKALRRLKKQMSHQTRPSQPVKKAADRMAKAFARTTRSEMRVASVAVVNREFARVVRRLAEVNPADASTLHRVRVALKKFRYAGEIAAPFERSLTARILKRTAEAQAQLGRIQDLEVLIGALRAWTDESGERTTRTARVVANLEIERAKTIANITAEAPQFAALWKAL